MDIRSFFGKAKGGKSKAAPSANDASSSGRNSVRSSGSKKKQVKSRKPIVLDDDSVTDEEVAVHEQQATSRDKKKLGQKKKQIVLDDDSTTDDEVVVPVQKKRKTTPEKPASSPAKKRKDQTESFEKKNRKEISVEDFFAENNVKKAASKPKKKNPLDDEPIELDESVSDTKDEKPTKKRERPPLGSEKDAEASESPVTKSSASPVTPPSTSSTPSKKKRVEKSPPPQKSPPKTKPPVKKMPPKTKSSKSKKDPLLEPTEPLASFNTDEAIPECLAGLTFVFSGVLPNLARDAAQDYVKILGGRVTTAVSGRTNYLVVGEILEDGRAYTEGSKYKKAMDSNVIIIKGEEYLYSLAKLYSDKARAQQPSREPTSVQNEATQVSPPSNSNAAQKPRTSIPANPYAKRSGAAVANPYAKKAKPAAAAKNPYASSKPASSQSTASPAAGGPKALWADKYAPQSTRDILGNQESVKKLAAWLSKWESTFNNPRAQGKSFAAPGGPRKAALLSGPPGIGKTTTALLVAKEAGRDTLEFNASDVRSKKGLTEGLGDVTGSQVLNFSASSSKKKGPPSKMRCIIMDEVDGMGAGDRSGMAELIKMIKSSKVPIICICNDRQSQKVRSLVPYCLDLRYKRPVKTVIARRAVRIGEMEGMRVEMNAAEAIAESCGNDIRQVLNCLQMWANKKGSNLNMTYKDVKERQGLINKDEVLRVSLFDATKQIVQGRRDLAGADAKAEKDSLYRRSDAYFVDYSLMGLMVQQNYLKVMIGQYQEAKRSGDNGKELDFLENMHSAASSMSDFAVAEHAVRGGDQNWGLLPLCGMLAVKTGYHAGGENGGFLPSFPEFAGWMGKNSTRGRKNRLLQELNHHMNYKVSGDSRELRLCYLPTMRERFLKLMTDKDGAKTTEVIELMDEYGLDRDDVFENLDEFKMDSKAKSFASLDSKQKAAFTREYNKGIHKSQALVSEQGVGKTRKQKAPSKDPDLVDPDAIDDDAVALESNDEGDKSDSEEIQKLFAKKGRAKGSTKKPAKKGKKTGSGKKG